MNYNQELHDDLKTKLIPLQLGLKYVQETQKMAIRFLDNTPLGAGLGESALKIL